MLDRVAHLPGAPCLLARDTQLGGIAFYHVNVLCRPNLKPKLKSKSFFGWAFYLLRLAAAQKITHTAHSLSQLGELYVKAGYESGH